MVYGLRVYLFYFILFYSTHHLQIFLVYAEYLLQSSFHFGALSLPHAISFLYVICFFLSPLFLCFSRPLSHILSPFFFGISCLWTNIMKNNRLDQWPNIYVRIAAEILKERKILHAELRKKLCRPRFEVIWTLTWTGWKCTTNCKASQSDSLHENWTLKEKRIWHEAEESTSLNRGKKNRKVTIKNKREDR